MSGLVLVVGAGPVGLTMALALKRRGVEVRIVDKSAARTDKSKALVMWPRTLELLDIEGCAQPFLAAGLQGTGARIFSDGKELVHLRFDIARSVFRFALMIPQSETERVLEELLANEGVTVERQVELTTFADDGDAVSAALRHADGQEESVRAAYLAACDGAHSTVRHGLALPFDGDTLPSDWMLADIRLDGELAREEITICWNSNGILALFPIIGDRFRVIADTGLGAAGDSTPPSIETVQALLDSRGPAGLRAHDAVWTSHFRINERKVKRYSQGRVYLAGDAAHVHSPAGGQGMNTGMQDALNLAWKLALVYHRKAAPALLDSYSVERSAIGDQVLRNAGLMTKVAMLRNPILQQLRNLAAETVSHVGAIRQRLVDQLTEVDLHYAHSPLTFAPRGAARFPVAGQRAPDVPLANEANGVRQLHEVLATGKFAVLSVGAALVDLPANLRSIASTASATPDPQYEPGHVYLIRPDGYLAMSIGSEDSAAVIAALAQIRGDC